MLTEQSTSLPFRASSLAAITVTGQTAAQPQGEQRQTGRLGDGPQWLCIEKIVHYHNVIDRVAERTIGCDRIEARGESNPADPLAGVGNRTHKTQPLVACDQSVSRENQQIVLVKELDAGRGGIVDIDENCAEGAGGGCNRRSRINEAHIRDVATDRGKKPLRVERPYFLPAL